MGPANIVNPASILWLLQHRALALELELLLEYEESQGGSEEAKGHHTIGAASTLERRC